MSVGAKLPVTALERGRPVIVENVIESVGIYDSESKQAMLAAGAHAVQSVPLKGAKGNVIGILSVLYRESHLGTAEELQYLKTLAELTTAVLGQDPLQADLPK